MKAWKLNQPEGIDQLVLTTATQPTPSAEDVCIKVEAVGLNPIDYKLAHWGYATWNYPQIIGLDIAGTITKVGKNVHNFQPGDRVMAFIDPRDGGGFAQYTKVKAYAVSRLPDNVSYAQAATLPCAGYSAWIAIHDKLRLESGQSIAITGAGGGVGGFAVQLAKQVGATVYAIADGQHHQRLLSYGADEVIDPHTENIAMRLIEYTEDKLVHGVIDCVSAKSGST